MNSERRGAGGADRRRVPRGGRRATDLPGQYPPVLIVDSSDEARSPCVRYLKRFGFQVEEATSGEQAVAAMDAVQPHVIVAELAPHSGSPLMTRLAENPRIPLIVTATDDASPVPPRAAAALFKPFSLAALLREVRRVLTFTERAADGVL